MIEPKDDEMIAEILGLPDDEGNVPFTLYWKIKCFDKFVQGMGSMIRKQGYYGRPEYVNTGDKKLTVVEYTYKI